MFASLIRSVLLAIPLAACLVAAVPQPAFAGSPDHGLAGIWEVSGAPDASAPVGPFLNFVTITRDGRVVNTDPEVGAGVGQSHRLGQRRFAIGFFGFLDIGMTARYEVQATVKLMHAGHFEGPFRTIVSDPAGNEIFRYEGTLSARRLGIQPF